MTTHVNGAGRPALAPLWTDQQLGHSSTTAFRAAQGPLISPSPMSSSRLPSPMYSTSSDGSARKKRRKLGGSRVNKVGSSSVSSPKLLSPIEGQSPLVSKLEKVSLQLATLNSPLAAQKHNILGPQEAFGNATTADAFIIARSIRRNGSPAANNSHPFWEDGSQKSELPNRLILRAVIRPKAPGRKTFLIQRNLDVDELRATVSTAHSDPLDKNASLSIMSRKPLPVPAKWSSNSRRPSLGLPSPQVEQSSKVISHLIDYDKLTRDSKTVPIHTQYITSSLPVLSTLLASGHVRKGDVIYLPVPHAESWSQTIRYVYTGEGELTVAMRENILYLGGRV